MSPAQLPQMARSSRSLLLMPQGSRAHAGRTSPRFAHVCGPLFAFSTTVFVACFCCMFVQVCDELGGPMQYLGSMYPTSEGREELRVRLLQYLPLREDLRYLPRETDLQDTRLKSLDLAPQKLTPPRSRDFGEKISGHPFRWQPRAGGAAPHRPRVFACAHHEAASVPARLQGDLG